MPKVQVKMSVSNRKFIQDIPMSTKRMRLLGDWLTSAMINNRMDNGNYYGLDARETKEVEHVLKGLMEICSTVEKEVSVEHKARTAI